MNLYFVVKALAAGPGGGAERVVTAIGSALAIRGHNVTLASFDPPGTTDFYPIHPKVKRVRLGIGETTRRSGLRVTGKRLRELRRMILVARPDVAIGFMHSAYIPLAIALIGSAIPVVAAERTAYRHYRRRHVQRALLHACVTLFARMVINGVEVRRGFPRRIARRMDVIANPVAGAAILAEPRGGLKKLLLTVGGMRPEKDQATLIEGFAQVAPAHSDWRLRIVGEGEMGPALAERVRTLGLTGSVELPGAVTDVAMEYRNAQLFALPSRYEAFPNCLAEALAHGLPAIGFADCPGTKELIQPGVNGELVQGSDRVTALAAALDDLMAAPDRRAALGAAAPGTVARFSLDFVAEQWEALLQEVSKPAPRWIEE